MTTFGKQTTTNMCLLYKDPCLWFKTIKKQYQNQKQNKHKYKHIFSITSLNKIYNELPIYEINSNSNVNIYDTLHYHKYIDNEHKKEQTVMKRQVKEKTSGKNSSIFRGLYNDEFVIFKTSKSHSKIQSDSDIIFLREILLQLELISILNSKKKVDKPSNNIMNENKYTSNFSADIPKIKFIFREKNSEYQTPKLYVIMEEIIGFTGRQFVINSNNTEYYNQDLIDMVKQVNSTVQTLQIACNFMHRDLHLSNIMFTCMEKNKHKPEEFEDTGSDSIFVCKHQKQWYIYDFEWCIIQFRTNMAHTQSHKRKRSLKRKRSKIKLRKTKIATSRHTIWINRYKEYPYNTFHSFNSSHDMRIFIFSLFTTLYKKFLNIYSINEDDHKIPSIKYRHLSIPLLLVSMFFIWNTRTYLTETHNVFFWNVYGDVVNKHDKYFVPKYIQRHFNINPFLLKTIKQLNCKNEIQYNEHASNTICSKLIFLQNELSE